MRQGTKTKSKTGSKNDEQRTTDTVNLRRTDTRGRNRKHGGAKITLNAIKDGTNKDPKDLSICALE